MRKLPIDLLALSGQMHIHHAWDSTACLDTETGDIYMLTNNMFDVDPNDEAAIQSISIFLQPLLPVAFAVRAGDPRIQRVPGIPYTERFVDMAKFAGTVADAELRDKLKAALREELGPDEAFYRVLRGHAAEGDRWSAFYDAQAEQRVRDWLASIGIEPIPRQPEDFDDDFEDFEDDQSLENPA